MARILIVDDSPLVRLKLKQLFERLQHTVLEAKNGEEGVRSYGRFKPDLVTMDLNMPKMDGIDAVEEIISKYPAAKIIMITSSGDERGVVSAIKNGARGYILKPFEDDKVIQVLNKVMADGS